MLLVDVTLNAKRQTKIRIRNPTMISITAWFEILATGTNLVYKHFVFFKVDCINEI